MDRDLLRPTELDQRRDNEVRRILHLIDEAEAKLEQQHKFLAEARLHGVTSKQLEHSVLLFEEALADLYGHLVEVQKLRV